MRNPLAIDLCCGLGGWTEGLIEEGYYVVGVDIERHVYGQYAYPAQLVVQDILTLHGSQFKNAALIVASPPCQEYSYMAMPWKIAKAKAAAIRADTTGTELERLNRLFNACFRIQREACEAAGRHIPMVVENVRGAIPWVGRSRWNHGSFHLWGDVPALMPIALRSVKMSGHSMSIGAPKWNMHHTECGTKIPGFRFDGSGRSFQSASVTRSQAYRDGQTESRDGVKHCGSGAIWGRTGPGSQSSKFTSRKMASAMIAKIPLPLSRHIAAVYKPLDGAREQG